MYLGHKFSRLLSVCYGGSGLGVVRRKQRSVFVVAVEEGGGGQGEGGGGGVSARCGGKNTTPLMARVENSYLYFIFFAHLWSLKLFLYSTNRWILLSFAEHKLPFSFSGLNS